MAVRARPPRRVPGDEGCGRAIQHDLRRARLSWQNLLDGPRGRGRHAADPGCTPQEVPHPAHRCWRGFNGRDFGADICCLASGPGRRCRGAQRHSQPCAVRAFPGCHREIIRRDEGRGPRTVRTPQRGTAFRAADNAHRCDRRRTRHSRAAGQRAPAPREAQGARQDRAAD